MLDHLELRQPDLAAAERFYSAALAVLGYTLQVRGRALGWGDAAGLDFFVAEGEAEPVTHFAFRAPDRAAVDAAWHTALGAGGRDAGAPRLQPEIHPDYYAAYVLDPAGHKVEFVCHRPQP
jgi:catechol 2,3-dioxygenase-like lactoylglutathione lyase family enzyme